MLINKMISNGKKVFVMTLLLLSSSCKVEKDKSLILKSLCVKVSAYNSVTQQTDSEPSIAAWGDTLRPKMKAIAVSRDLIDSGLTYNTKVRIKGLPGIYLVKDKMNKRWKKRIDIYMGNQVEKAKAWGVKELEIFYAVAMDSIPTEK